MNTPDTEWDETTQHAYDSILFNHNPVEADKQFGKMLESVLNNLISSRDTYWKERVQGVREECMKEIEDARSEHNEARHGTTTDDAYDRACDAINPKLKTLY